MVKKTDIEKSAEQRQKFQQERTERVQKDSSKASFNKDGKDVSFNFNEGKFE